MYMKVTLYTINDADSEFCKQAKDMLTTHNIPFENKDVEHDRKALADMQAASDNFSGVPVMVVEDAPDGEKKVVKGFTPQEFEQALGLSSQAEPAVAPVAMPTPVEPEPVEPAAPAEPDQNTMQMPQTDTPPAGGSAPVEPPIAPAMPAPMETPMETPAAPAEDDKLKGIMDTLSQTAAAPTPSAPVEPPVVETPTVETPAEPVAPLEPPMPAEPVSETPAAPTAAEPATPNEDMPSIPDFPQK